jgi:hypothetical protein
MNRGVGLERALACHWGGFLSLPRSREKGFLLSPEAPKERQEKNVTPIGLVGCDEQILAPRTPIAVPGGLPSGRKDGPRARSLALDGW